MIEVDAAGGSIVRERLYDFLRESFIEESDAHSLAGHALDYFCRDDGAWNGNVSALQAVIAFLEQSTGSDRTKSSLENLRSRITADAATPEDLAAWARGAFPSA